VKIASPLYREGDLRMAEILAERVREVMVRGGIGEGKTRVALVDHGSPVPAVTAVRDRLARQLASKLGRALEQVTPCSMERRPGREYDFNEPLLETLLGQEGWREATVIVAQLFLVPGRHAGENGDVATICRRAEQNLPKLRTRRTATLSGHPGLIEILADRWREVSGAAKP
jgi:hypothetical protein